MAEAAESPPSINPVLCACYRVALEYERHNVLESRLVKSLLEYVVRLLPGVISDGETGCKAFGKVLEDLVATNASLQSQLSLKLCDQAGLPSVWEERVKQLSTSARRLLACDDPVQKSFGLGQTLALLQAASFLDSHAQQLRQSNTSTESRGYLSIALLQPLLAVSSRECGVSVLVDAVRSMSLIRKEEGVASISSQLLPCMI